MARLSPISNPHRLAPTQLQQINYFILPSPDFTLHLYNYQGPDPKYQQWLQAIALTAKPLCFLALEVSVANNDGSQANRLELP